MKKFGDKLRSSRGGSNRLEYRKERLGKLEGLLKRLKRGWRGWKKRMRGFRRVIQWLEKSLEGVEGLGKGLRKLGGG